MQDTQRRRNIKSHIDQIIKGYNTEPAKGLVHGFQKDAIQNSWGHRKNKRGTDWKLIFRLINNDKGNFLVVEDCGCSGLTGKNYSQDELSEMMSRDEFLGENEKLARFSTLNNSGGNQTSAGTYGRGKQMYQAVSKDLKYYFDSLTKDGNYVANYINSEENTKIKAYEDHEAKSYILEETLLSEKNTIGTRVIITNPIDDIVEAIKSKSILKDIEETWWRILQKYSATIELYDNDTYLGKANVPEFYLKEMSDVMYKEYENYTSSAGYVVKRLGIGYCKDPIPEELSNISYYRKDMKIGEVYWLSDLPVDEEHKSHIWGFIEFDDNGNWETELKNNENLEHYGPEKRSKKDFQELKKTIKSKLQDFLLLKGLVKKDKKSDPNQELNDFANDLADFLKDSNFDFSWDNGKRDKKDPPFDITTDKKYPNFPVRTVEYSQQLNFNLNVSTNANMSNCICNCRIITSSDNEERELDNFDFAFTEGVYLKEDIVLKYDSLINNCRNIITILVEDKLNSNIKCKHMFPIYVDIDDEKSIDDFDIKFDYELPNENLSIYKGESIKDLQVDIYNNTLENGIFNLKVLTQDVQDRNNTIAEEYNIKNIELMSGKMKSIKLGDICFDEKYFSRKGAIRVKFILTHKSGISSREIGEKVMEPYFTILFETEQIDNSLKLPIKISQRPYENTHVKFDLNELSDKRYELIFNTNYSLWKLIGEDTNRKKMYTIEELFRQIVNIKLEKRDFSIINRTEKQVDDLSAHELHQLIELVVNEYVGNFFEVR